MIINSKRQVKIGWSLKVSQKSTKHTVDLLICGSLCRASGIGHIHSENCLFLHRILKKAYKLGQ